MRLRLGCPSEQDWSGSPAELLGVVFSGDVLVVAVSVVLSFSQELSVGALVAIVDALPWAEVVFGLEVGLLLTPEGFASSGSALL